MQEYEGMFIVDPRLNEDALEQAISSIEEEIAKNGGEIKKRDPWGRRRLAYPINKHREGFYYRLDFLVDEKQIDRLKKTYRLNESILRILITRRSNEART